MELYNSKTTRRVLINQNESITGHTEHQKYSYQLFNNALIGISKRLKLKFKLTMK